MTHSWQVKNENYSILLFNVRIAFSLKSLHINFIYIRTFFISLLLLVCACVAGLLPLAVHRTPALRLESAQLPLLEDEQELSTSSDPPQ